MPLFVGETPNLRHHEKYSRVIPCHVSHRFQPQFFLSEPRKELSSFYFSDNLLNFYNVRVSKNCVILAEASRCLGLRQHGLGFKKESFKEEFFEF